MAYAHRTYKRTVRCSYCRQKGHNKSKCPTYEERVEKMRHDYGSDYWMVVQYDEKKAKRKAKGADRKCSYCSEGGHNRGTCTILADHMQQTKEANIAYRKTVFQSMVNHGIFVGSVVTTDSFNCDPDGGNRYLAPWVITEVCWEDINLWETEFRYYSAQIGERAPLRMAPLSNPFKSYTHSVGFPHDYTMQYNKMGFTQFARWEQADTWYGQYRNSYFPTVISKVNAQKPPLGWLLCEDEGFEKTLKEFYKKRKNHVYIGLAMKDSAI